MYVNGEKRFREETLEYANHNHSYILEVLNRIIEKSVDDSMFVSVVILRSI
ncbi:hypothetical protein UACE39S_05973 [Ureibacillus acetophenoni]